MTTYTVTDLKLIAIAVIAFGSYFFGILPNLLGLGTRLKNSVTLSSTLCFGGGVLFATSVIHILPDIRKDLTDWSEYVFCSGYLLIYFFDILVDLLTGQHKKEGECINREDGNSRTYGAINDYPDTNQQNQDPEVKVKTHIRCLDLGLLFAFTLHSLLEGLVIGVESTQAGVLLLLTAVCCHKLLVAFCLGAELSSGGQPLYAILPALSVFVGGSSAGVAIGIVLHPGTSPFIEKLVPILQGLAGGTLLYVVVTEILPRERAKKLPKYSAIVQFFSLSCGFIFMACLSTLT